MPSAQKEMNLVSVALKARDVGLSVIPIQLGTKRPKNAVLPRLQDDKTEKSVPKWEPFQERLPTDEEIERFFEGPDVDLAVVCGKVSGNLEAIDFDLPKAEKEVHTRNGTKGEAPAWQPFKDFLNSHGLKDLLQKVVTIQTRTGGIHLVYRCDNAPEPSQKLAERERQSKGVTLTEVLIETRGEGGYIVTWPTEGYVVLEGKLNAIPVLTADERELLLNACRLFNERVVKREPASIDPEANTPWKWFNDNKTWEEILPSLGFTEFGQSTGGRIAYTRPGKGVRLGPSVTTGNSPDDLLYVHSTNCSPLEAGRSYSKFMVEAQYRHGGDYKRMASFVRRELMPMVGPTEQSQNGEAAHVAGGTYRAPLILTSSFAPARIKAHEREGCPVPWLVYPYAARGVVQGIEGLPGVRKTFLLEALATALSRGAAIPALGSEQLPQGRVLLLTCEDSTDFTTIPRLRDMGADLTQIEIVEDVWPFDAKGLEILRDMVCDFKPIMVGIDGLTKHIDAACKIAKPTVEPAGIMNGLKQIAEESFAALFINRHLRKSSSQDLDPILSGLGDTSIGGTCRSILQIRKDPEGRPFRSIAQHIKSNIGPLGRAFWYEIRPVDRDRAEFFWGDTIDTDMSGSPIAQPSTSAEEEAKRFLIELCLGQYVRSTEVYAQAKLVGISATTINRVKSAIGCISTKRGFTDGHWRFYIEDRRQERAYPLEVSA